MAQQHRVHDASEFAACVAGLGLPAPWVVGLPWGAMPFAADLASALCAPLDKLLIHDDESVQHPPHGLPQPLLLGRSVVLVDDGSTDPLVLLSALQGLRGMRPHSVILVSPILPQALDAALAAQFDHLVCLMPRLRIAAANPLRPAAERVDWPLVARV